MPNIEPLAGSRPRRIAVELEYPLSVDGRPLRTIFIQRLSVGAIGTYFDRIAEAQKADADAEAPPYPGITDVNNDPIPAEVLKALDADDEDRLNEALLDFLPARLRPTTTASEPSASPSPSSGDQSANSSEASPAGLSPS